jgi:N-glycosylase/DNA lyase
LKIKDKIKILQEDENIVEIINRRIKEFREIHGNGSECWFRELCFCLLTANYTAQGAINICREESKTGAFMACPVEDLSGFLKKHKHRFPNARAKYIYEARQHCTEIKKIIEDFKDEREAREWLVKNIKGLGYKEASHFLRNMGYENVAIIDRHILNVLYENKIIPEIPKTMSKKKYLEIEKQLEKIAGEVNMNLAELDFYLWYMKTGKVLK